VHIQQAMKSIGESRSDLTSEVEVETQ
jgi:hypothetical protein